MIDQGGASRNAVRLPRADVSIISRHNQKGMTMRFGMMRAAVFATGLLLASVGQTALAQPAKTYSAKAFYETTSYANAPDSEHERSWAVFPQHCLYQVVEIEMED